MLNKTSYIVVEGPIGAGKTSLSRRLAERLGMQTLLEQPEVNPFLGRFYQNMERWALATQLSFLLQRAELLQDLQKLRHNKQRVVSDFLLDKDPLFASLNLAEDEARIYQELYECLQLQAPAPDLVIYLQAQPEILFERVHKRGLDSERPISESYLEKVAERYASFFHQYDAAPLFIVNAEVLNPVDQDDDFDLLFQHLNAMRSYREFFGYAE